MPFEDKEKPEPQASFEDLAPALKVPHVTLNDTLKLGVVKAEDSKVNPFRISGAGMYTWYFAENERTNKMPVDNDGREEEFKASSPGISVGGGVEYSAMERLGLFGSVNHRYVIMEDEDKFGPNFDNQGFLMFGAGVNYYFPVTSE